MFRELMGLEIHFRLKDVCLVCLTFSVKTHKMGVGKMLFQHLIVQIVLRVTTAVSPITDMALLMLFSAVCVKLVISIESLATESTFWMPSES